MKVISFGNTRKFIMLLVGISLAVVFILGLWLYDKRLGYVKADRSNSVQVTKSVAGEQMVPASIPDFFVEYRLERDRISSEKTDLLRETIKTAHNDEVRQRAQDNILKMVAQKQRETEIEGLIKARGFADVLVFTKDEAVSVIVKTASLGKEEVIQIADIVSRVSGVKFEDITISAKP